MKSLFVTLILSLTVANAFKWHHERGVASQDHTVCENAQHAGLMDNDDFHQFMKRQVGGSGTVTGGANVGNVSANVGPISAGVGNINITIGNVTVQAGDITVENIVIGNITVLVSVALSANSASQTPAATAVGTAIPSTSIASTSIAPTTLSTAPTMITVTPTPTQTSGVGRRQAVPSLTVPSVSASASVGATAGVGDVGIGVGSVSASVGNVTLTVGNILVKLGSIIIKNVTIGNIVVAVQIGQPSQTNGSLLQNLLGS